MGHFHHFPVVFGPEGPKARENEEFYVFLLLFLAKGPRNKERKAVNS